MRPDWVAVPRPSVASARPVALARVLRTPSDMGNMLLLVPILALSVGAVSILVTAPDEP